MSMSSYFIKKDQTDNYSDAYIPINKKPIIISYINKWLETRTSLDVSDLVS